MNIQVGQAFPALSSTSHTGETIQLEDYQGKKNVVLYFYPKDRTPGCTREAIDFDRLLDDFHAADTEVIGMSVDSLDSHNEFSIQCGLRFPLLSDEEGKLGSQLGILNEKGLTKRVTFVIDKTGVVRQIYEVKSVDGHAQEVLEFVRTLDA